MIKFRAICLSKSLDGSGTYSCKPLMNLKISGLLRPMEKVEAFNDSFELEEAEEDYEEETIVLWDEFNHLDVKTNKDIFLIESSGLVLKKLIGDMNFSSHF